VLPYPRLFTSSPRKTQVTRVCPQMNPYYCILLSICLLGPGSLPGVWSHRGARRPLQRQHAFAGFIEEPDMTDDDPSTPPKQTPSFTPHPNLVRQVQEAVTTEKAFLSSIASVAKVCRCMHVPCDRASRSSRRDGGASDRRVLACSS
jgi:hypothetical protein